jgi:hypothetical protein
MNQLLETIANQAAEDLKKLICEGADDILTAIHKMQAESQLQEVKPKFTLGYKIAVDFDKSAYDCDLSWSLKQSLSTSHHIDDPAQTKLPLEKGGDGAVKKTLGEMKKQKLAKKN